MIRRLHIPFLAVGLCVGLGLTWLVVPRAPDEARGDDVARDREARFATAPPSPERATTPPVAPVVEKDAEPTWAQRIASGDRDAILRAGGDEDVAVGPADVPVLVKGLGDARRKRDFNLFCAFLEALARSGHEQAHAALLAVLDDETLPLPDPAGDILFKGLEHAELPGISDAARRRIERIAKADADPSREGWAELVATHGGVAELEWMLATLEDERFPDFDHLDVAAQLARTRDAQALDRIEELLRSDEPEGFVATVLGGLVEHHPTRATRVLEGFLDRALRSGERPQDIRLEELMTDYGSAVPEDEIEAARERLLTVRRLDERVAAVFAVDSLARRELDVSGLEAITQAPVDLLAGLRPGDAHELQHGRRGGLALDAIGRYRPLWTEATAEVLEATVDRLRLAPESEPVELLKKIRAALASPWTVR